MLVWWQEGHPACKTLERGGAGVVTSLKQGARHSLSVASVKSRLFFIFLVPADPGSPGQRAIKRVRVCVLKDVMTNYCEFSEGTSFVLKVLHN